LTKAARIAPAFTALALALAPAAFVAITPAPALAQAANAAEGARFNAFLDAEYAQQQKFSPQQATAQGSKEDQDKLNDLSDAADLKRLEWRRGSAGRMKAQFQRDKLPLEGRISYDMWLDELDSAELGYRFRAYQEATGAHSACPTS